jgi:hypothetical protein
MTTARDKAREEVLLDGFVDWINFNQVHSQVAQHYRSASLSEVQNETLGLIRSLVSEGLFELGDRSGQDGRFTAWDEPLDVSMQRIFDAYVTHFDNRPGWVWCCWLNESDKGQQLVLSTDKGRQLAREVDERLREIRDSGGG